MYSAQYVAVISKPLENTNDQKLFVDIHSKAW